MATVSNYTVPYTLIECPSCGSKIKEVNPLKQIEQGRPFSHCKECGANLLMEKVQSTKVKKIYTKEI